MKKISFFLVGIIFAMSNVFVGCSSDNNDDDDPFKSPKIEVRVVQGNESNPRMIASNSTLQGDQGDAVKFEIVYTMGDNKLKHIKNTLLFGGETIVLVDSVLNQGIFNGADRSLTYRYETNIGALDKKLTFRTTDTKDRVTEFYVTLQTKLPEGEFVTSDITLLGAQRNATIGSFYSVELSEVLLLRAAAANSGSVDFAYYFGATNRATIASILDPSIQSIFPSTSSWTKRQTTFSNLGNRGSNPQEWWNEAINLTNTATVTLANALSVNDVVAFKRHNGEIGAFRVNAINSENAGSISITLYKKIR